MWAHVARAFHRHPHHSNHTRHPDHDRRERILETRNVRDPKLLDRERIESSSSMWGLASKAKEYDSRVKQEGMQKKHTKWQS